MLKNLFVNQTQTLIYISVCVHVCMCACVCVKRKNKGWLKERKSEAEKKTWILRVLGSVFFKGRLMESNITAETLSSLLSVRAFE